MKRQFLIWPQRRRLWAWLKKRRQRTEIDRPKTQPVRPEKPTRSTPKDGLRESSS